VADSLQLSHLHTKIEPHSGQLNLRHLSLGMMCLWQQLQTGNSRFEDISV